MLTVHLHTTLSGSKQISCSHHCWHWTALSQCSNNSDTVTVNVWCTTQLTYTWLVVFTQAPITST